MHGFVKKILAICIFSCLMATSVKPITEELAADEANMWGSIIGLASGGLCYYYLHNQPTWNNSQSLKILTSLLVGAGLGVLARTLIYANLCQNTPQARIATARIIINNTENNRLIASTQNKPEEIGKKATAYMGTSWPLILARDNLFGETYSLDYAQELILKAEDDIKANKSLSHLEKDCEHLLKKIVVLKKHIETCLEILVQDQDYRFQVDHREKYLEAERQREHEASLLHQQLAHVSAEKYATRQHDSTEKDRDRQLKQNLIGQMRDRPTNVNINI